MARVVKSVQTLLLGCAGIGAFYAAAHWSAPARGGDIDVDLARPPMDASPRPAARASDAPAAASAPSGRAPVPTRGDRAAVIPGETKELFAVLSWLPPPPPPPPPVVAPPPPPPAPPAAPPLPFTFVGMVERGTPTPQAFIAKGDALFVVSVGDTVDTSYRIDSLTADAVVMTYLPLNTRQTLNTNTGSK